MTAKPTMSFDEWRRQTAEILEERLGRDRQREGPARQVEPVQGEVRRRPGNQFLGTQWTDDSFWNHWAQRARAVAGQRLREIGEQYNRRNELLDDMPMTATEVIRGQNQGRTADLMRHLQEYAALEQRDLEARVMGVDPAVGRSSTTFTRQVTLPGGTRATETVREPAATFRITPESPEGEAPSLTLQTLMNSVRFMQREPYTERDCEMHIFGHRTHMRSIPGHELRQIRTWLEENFGELTVWQREALESLTRDVQRAPSSLEFIHHELRPDFTAPREEADRRFQDAFAGNFAAAHRHAVALCREEPRHTRFIMTTARPLSRQVSDDGHIPDPPLYVEFPLPAMGLSLTEYEKRWRSNLHALTRERLGWTEDRYRFYASRNFREIRETLRPQQEGSERCRSETSSSTTRSPRESGRSWLSRMAERSATSESDRPTDASTSQTSAPDESPGRSTGSDSEGSPRSSEPDDPRRSSR